MNTLHVHVRERHILKGRRSSRFLCPVALAIREQLPKAKQVVVRLDLITIDGVDYVTPKPAAQFMGYYDQSKKKEDVEPIKFKLPKACRICRHAEHQPGKCNKLVDISSETIHSCPCGKS